MPQYFKHAPAGSQVESEFLAAIEASPMSFRVEFPFESQAEFLAYVKNVQKHEDMKFLACAGTLTAEVSLPEAFLLQSLAASAPAPVLPLFKDGFAVSRLHLGELPPSSIVGVMQFYAEMIGEAACDEVMRNVNQFSLSLEALEGQVSNTSLTQHIDTVADAIRTYLKGVALTEHVVDHNYQDLYASIFTDDNPAFQIYAQRLAPPVSNVVESLTERGEEPAVNGGLPAILRQHLQAQVPTGLPKLGDLIANDRHLKAMADALFDGVFDVPETRQIGVVSRFTHSTAKVERLIEGIKASCKAVNEKPETIVFKGPLAGYSASSQIFSDGTFAYVVVVDNKAPEGYLYYAPAAGGLRLDRASLLTFTEAGTRDDSKFILPTPDLNQITDRLSEVLSYNFGMESSQAASSPLSRLVGKINQAVAEISLANHPYLRSLGFKSAPDHMDGVPTVALAEDVCTVSVRPVFGKEDGVISGLDIEIHEYGALDDVYELRLNGDGLDDAIATIGGILSQIKSQYGYSNSPAPSPMRLH